MNDIARPAAGLTRIAGLVALSLLAGCAMFGASDEEAARAPVEGHEARFAKPAAISSQRILLNSNEVAGHRVQITDEGGPFWLNLSRDHGVTAGLGNRLIVQDGTWRVDKTGHLCLKSSVWWKAGTCFELFGGRHFAQATVIHSLSKQNGPNTYYPFEILGPAN